MRSGDLDRIRAICADTAVMGEIRRKDVVDQFHMSCGLDALPVIRLQYELHRLTRDEVLSDHLFALLFALERGRDDVVAWLHQDFAIRAEEVLPHIGLIFDQVIARNGDARIMRQVQERWDLVRLATVRQRHKLARVALTMGWLAVVQCFDELGADMHVGIGERWDLNIERTFALVCASGSLETAQWFAARFALTRAEASALEAFAFRYACETNDRAMAQWLVAQYGLGAHHLRYSTHPGLTEARSSADEAWLRGFLVAEAQDAVPETRTPPPEVSDRASSSYQQRLMVDTAGAKLLAMRAKTRDHVKRAIATRMSRASRSAPDGVSTTCIGVDGGTLAMILEEALREDLQSEPQPPSPPSPPPPPPSPQG